MKNTALFFGNNLHDYRKRMGLKQSDVAEKIDVNVRTYQQYEYGQIQPSDAIKAALANLFKVTIADLYESPSDRNKPKSIDVNKAELLTSLYSIAPTLTENDLRKVVDLASSFFKK